MDAVSCRLACCCGAGAGGGGGNASEDRDKQEWQAPLLLHTRESVSLADIRWSNNVHVQ